MFTDGLIDARPPDGEPFGQDSVVENVGKHCDLPAQQMAQAIIDSAFNYAGGSLRDDIALLVVRLMKQ
jgi:serine phosphatase RsbU (regulator of sigma subunit)